GTISATLVQVAPLSGSVYNVTVSGIAGIGTLGLNFVDNGSVFGLFPNDYSFSVQDQQTFEAGAGAKSVASADVNGDGFADLVVANYHDYSVSVLLGNGDGSFQDQQTYDAGAEPISVAVADVNGDGQPDIVVANFDDDTVSVL